MDLLTKTFQFAAEKHQGQQKAGRPFFYHPLAVASLVLKYGGNENQAAAAMLHDTISDPSVTWEALSGHFNPEIADLVFAFQDPPLPEGTAADWRNLRKAYLDKVRDLDLSKLLVIACEELHEVSELLQDLRTEGRTVFSRYPVDEFALGWYYKELFKILFQKLPSEKYKGLIGEFATTTRALSEIIFERTSV